MSGKDLNSGFDDYELGGEGLLPSGLFADSTPSLDSSGIKSSVQPILASLAAFRDEPPPADLKPTVGYLVEDLGAHSCVPPDFAPTNDKARMDTLPADFDPGQIWGRAPK